MRCDIANIFVSVVLKAVVGQVLYVKLIIVISLLIFVLWCFFSDNQVVKSENIIWQFRSLMRPDRLIRLPKELFEGLHSLALPRGHFKGVLTCEATRLRQSLVFCKWSSSQTSAEDIFVRSSDSLVIHDIFAIGLLLQV